MTKNQLIEIIRQKITNLNDVMKFDSPHLELWEIEENEIEIHIWKDVLQLVKLLDG